MKQCSWQEPDDYCFNNVEGRTDYCARHNRLMRKAEETAKNQANALAIKLLKSKEVKPRKSIKKVSDKMKENPSNYKQVYWDYFDYKEGETIPCEICRRDSVDIHHISARGMGGDPNHKKDVIENLMALCREHHDEFGDKKQYMDYLITIHANYLRPKETI